MKKIFITPGTTALLLLLAGCGGQPAKDSEAIVQQDQMPVSQADESAGEAPVANEAPTTSDAPAPAEVDKPAIKPANPRPPQAAPAKAAPPQQKKSAPEAPKPAEPDPHAGHDMDKM